MTTKFAELMKDQEFQKLYDAEELIGGAAELIWQLLVRRNLKQADLARLLNKTPAFVSQLLNGKSNMTVRTLAEVASALGAKIKIDAIDENAQAAESEDRSQSHTFHLPASQMRAKSESVFQFENGGAKRERRSSTRASDTRLEYVA